MKSLPVARSSGAEQDILAIWDYIAKDSPDAADEMICRIDARISQLSRQPRMGERVQHPTSNLQICGD